METGAAVVLDHGDLALALRSSMSVPGLFAPTELGGRMLGDGGLVNKLPLDVARALGADVVIVVNIGTPLAGRDSLVSAVGLTSQMINLETAVGRARVGRVGARWQGATTLRAHAREEAQRRQRAPACASVRQRGSIGCVALSPRR